MPIANRAERFSVEHREPSLARIPARVRGEAFDQKPNVTYCFGDNEIVANLVAMHDERAIVVQVDVSTTSLVSREWPRLTQRRVRRSKLLLATLRSRFVGFRTSVIRLLRGKQQAFHVEGPFIPHQSRLALMTLVINVSRDANYDLAYGKARRFLELHHENDDRPRFAQTWNRATSPPTIECYSWSPEELFTIEQIARLEPVAYASDDDLKLKLARRKYNEMLLRKCHSSVNAIDDACSASARAANDTLREFIAD